MQPLEDGIDSVVRDAGFSGVVRVERAGTTEFVRAYGFADRAHAIDNTVDTRFAIASGTKGFTALTIMSLIEQGSLALDTTARSLLGDDLPLIDDAVTVEHLLAHRSGIGDYLDESTVEVTDYVMPVSVHELAMTEQFLVVLDGHETVSVPDERFAYNNGGYVVLALIAERASGVPFHDLVRRRVCEPAGMTDTGFLRSDELPGDAALGYLTATDRGRTSSTCPCSVPATAASTRPRPISAPSGPRCSPGGSSRTTAWPRWCARSDWPEESRRYGLGFHLHESTDVVWLEGYDAGVSFCSTHDPTRSITHTVIANWTDGAWPVLIRLDELLGT